MTAINRQLTGKLKWNGLGWEDRAPQRLIQSLHEGSVYVIARPLLQVSKAIANSQNQTPRYTVNAWMSVP